MDILIKSKNKIVDSKLKTITYCNNCNNCNKVLLLI